MEPVRNDTTTDRRTAVELAKRLLVDSIWRTAKIEVDGVTFPDTTVNNIKRAWGLACISRFTLCAIWFTLTPIRRTCAPVSLIAATVGGLSWHKLAYGAWRLRSR